MVNVVITKDEIDNIIKANGIIFVNDLTKDFKTENFIEIIDCLHQMGVNNQKIKIKVYCKECGTELIVRPSQYKKQKHFHCEEHIVHRISGENSLFYNRVKVLCTNCGKEYSVIPYDYNKKNRFGDNHNFCCQQCYWEYRSKYYINDKHHMLGTHQTEANKQKQRELAAKMIANGDMPQTMTKPHRKINDLLISYNINFENEHLEKYHSIDIFLLDYNLMIEIMGDYWHAHPLKYNIEKLTKQQKKSIKQDRSKYTYVKKYEKIEILYLWEQDINKNLDLCWALIQEYINNNGKLSNYHSFNYHLDEGELMLNDIIVIPFQEKRNNDDCLLCAI